MKIIHTADIHLGSPGFESEGRDAFLKICLFAKKEEARMVLLSGDVFDGETPDVDEVKSFVDTVKSFPDVTFVYLSGNHDANVLSDAPPNLVLFNGNFSQISRDNVNVVGISAYSENPNNFYSQINFRNDAFNILMLHGTVSASAGEGLIKVSSLKYNNIDYLALGHIHSYSIERLDFRGVYAYPGCPYSRGNDETGKKGFILVDTDYKSFDFVELDVNITYEFSVDVSSLESTYEIASVILKKAPKNSEKIRVNLIGELDACVVQPEKAILVYLKDSFKSVSIVNDTVPKIVKNEIKSEISMRGEFTRLVDADDSLTEKQKNEIIRIGLAALSGRAF